MRRLVTGLVLALALIVLWGVPTILADAPIKTRSVVYRVNVFNGRGHVYTDAPAQAATLYAIAGTPLVLNPRTTMVYYWDTTRRNLADWAALDEPITGTLEILQAGRVISTTQREPYVLTHRVENPLEAILSVGPAATQEYQTYQAGLNHYWSAASEYQNRMIEYDRALREYVAQKAGGKDVPTPQQPQPVATLDSYTTSPEVGFILALPVGTYELRVRAPDGRIVPGSNRDLAVFTWRREGVAYSILPASKWTVSERSNAPEETIYARANTTVYPQPFFSQEYPALEYGRLQDPQETELVSGWTWVDLHPLTLVGLRVRGDSQDQEIAAKPYYVRQTPGSSLGYEIIEYDATTMTGLAPSFTAFQLTLSRPSQIEIIDARKSYVESSMRAVRLVTFSDHWVLYLPMLVVLVTAAGMLYHTHTRNK